MTDSAGLEKEFVKWIKQVNIGGELITKKTAVRIRRAISWLRRAEKENKDEDARVIFLWISFNALYGVKSGDMEQTKYKNFLKEIIEVDTLKKIQGAIRRCQGECLKLVENRYIDETYWKNVKQYIQNPIGQEKPEDEWDSKEEKGEYGSISKIEYQSLDKFLKSGKCNEKSLPANLIKIFDRLYVLRNQVVHGSATWSEYVNRDQIEDGAKVLEVLIPVFIKLILSNTESGQGGKLGPKNWGDIYYPPYLLWDDEKYFL